MSQWLRPPCSLWADHMNTGASLLGRLVSSTLIIDESFRLFSNKKSSMKICCSVTKETTEAVFYLYKHSDQSWHWLTDFLCFCAETCLRLWRVEGRGVGLLVIQRWRWRDAGNVQDFILKGRSLPVSVTSPGLWPVQSLFVSTCKYCVVSVWSCFLSLLSVVFTALSYTFGSQLPSPAWIQGFCLQPAGHSCRSSKRAAVGLSLILRQVRSLQSRFFLACFFAAQLWLTGSAPISAFTAL